MYLPVLLLEGALDDARAGRGNPANYLASPANAYSPFVQQVLIFPPVIFFGW